MIVLAFGTLMPLLANAQFPTFNSVTPNSASIARFDKLELTMDITAVYTNAYDYDDISVQSIFTDANGKKDTVDGFYFQNSGGGAAAFKVRYSPSVVGMYSYVLSCKTLTGTTLEAARTFDCTASAAPGFIRKNTSNYLTFDNGSQYIPIGENMGWQNGGVISSYTSWLTKLADNGGNFIRVWMSSWAFALEWKTGGNYQGLKKYNQTNAGNLDWLLDYCKQKNVYIMLALNNHGQVSTTVNPEWSNNPYNTANAGPAPNTWDFFTNALAKSLHKNRLRYLIARYGYSQQIQSWELFNEVEWTDQFDAHKTEIKDWHNEMAGYIKEKDVYKHLVTTSYAHDYNDDATWNLANIDITQTHFYVNSPSIESVLASASQSYLTKFGKPTLNGEFGLTTDGANLSTTDPNGIHIHNTLWASAFSGAMGTAMTWWWDNYIDPQNLYYHFKPLSDVVSLLNLPGDNYKKVSATTSGGGTSDVTISPGGGFAKATAADFTIDATGNMTPGSSSMSQYIFGSTYNTQYRNPPTFTVTYPVAGQFKVVTAGVSGSSPKITIYLDGILSLNENATANSTYTINISAGPHTIKVDNLGIDWAQVSNFVFTNIGSPLTVYALKSMANNKAAGYILNNKYNWQYLKNNGNTAPPAVTGTSLSLPGLVNGDYTLFIYSASTGSQQSATQISVSNGTLSASLPSVAWDLAFRLAENSTLPIKLHSFKGATAAGKNNLFIDIASSENVKAVSIERGGTPTDFFLLSTVSNQWNVIEGKHAYTDEAPLMGDNFYRLRILDKDGSITYSSVIKLVNKTLAFSVQPNPFSNIIIVQMPGGTYQVSIIDQLGKTLLRKTARSLSPQTLNISTNNLARGMYYAAVTDSSGQLVGYEKIIK